MLASYALDPRNAFDQTNPKLNWTAINQSLTNSTPEYSQAGVYSRFLSTAFGRFEDDEFILDPAYQPLASMIRSDKQQEIACDTI